MLTIQWKEATNYCDTRRKEELIQGRLTQYWHQLSQLTNSFVLDQFCIFPKKRNVAHSFELRRRLSLPRTGFEPARVAPLPPQSSASANFATWAWWGKYMRRLRGVEGWGELRVMCCELRVKIGETEHSQAFTHNSVPATRNSPDLQPAPINWRS